MWTLVPFLETLEENLRYTYTSITADSGYESEEADEYLKRKNRFPIIKPQIYEKWKKRCFKQDISKHENMSYNETLNYYTCHAGKD